MDVKLKLKKGSATHKMSLPTIDSLKVCGTKDKEKGNVMKLYEAERIKKKGDCYNELKLLTAVAQTGRLEGVEHFEMFRVKLGGKKLDLENGYTNEKLRLEAKVRLCATNETTDHVKTVCFKVANKNSLFCDDCEKSSKWLSRWTPPKLLFVWEDKVTKIPKPPVKEFEPKIVTNNDTPDENAKQKWVRQSEIIRHGFHVMIEDWKNFKPTQVTIEKILHLEKEVLNKNFIPKGEMTLYDKLIMIWTISLDRQVSKQNFKKLFLIKFIR